jgi:hypothetical protein
MMQLSKGDLEWAVGRELLTAAQVDPLWSALKERKADAPKFDMVHLAYYAGAIIVILAMVWFLSISWEAFGAGGVLAISGIYAFMFVLAGRHLWFEQKLLVPGGLLYTLAVCMVPLIIYAIEKLTGIWPQGDPGTYQNFHMLVKGSWFLMEIGTIAASLFVLRHIRFPFLTAPIAFSLWYMSMDMTPLLLGKTEYSWDGRLIVSAIFGLAMLATAYWVDLKRKGSKDFAFWIYLFGTVAFFSGVAGLNKGGELNEFACAAVFAFMMVVSVLVQRRVLMIFGAMGVVGYFFHLAWTVFQDTPVFPIALSGLGIAIIAAGVYMQRNRTRIEDFIVNSVPTSLKAYLPQN